MKAFIGSAALAALVCFGCGRASEPPTVTPVACPAGPGSGDPTFVRLQGKLALSWVEPGDSGHRLLVSTLATSSAFDAPVEAAAGEDWFVSWADRPAVVSGEQGTRAAYWLAYSDSAGRAFDAWTRVSPDGGATWSSPTRINRDGVPAEHGFASFVPEAGGFRVVWLDGRETAAPAGENGGEPGPMTLRSAYLSAEGEITDDRLLDPRVCDCCPTTAVSVGDGIVAAYRDRSPEEVRDIYTVRYSQGQWSRPRPVARDGWQIQGCPVNGPDLAVSGGRLACLWYTAVGDSGRVQVAVSRDGGVSFDPPIRVDGGRALGRVDAEAVEDGLFVLLWVEQAAPEEGSGDGEEARIQARVLFPQGRLGKVQTLARTSDSRAAGFPRIAREGEAFYVAWTQPGEPSQVRVVRWSPEWLSL